MAYPLLPTGFAISGTLMEALVEPFKTEPPFKAFNIDPAFALAQTLSDRLKVWLDWATIQFRFIGPAVRCTGSFCVFGPVLSSPAHASISLDMRQIEIEIVFVL
jgi:hypothetical protein